MSEAMTSVTLADNGPLGHPGVAQVQHYEGSVHLRIRTAEEPLDVAITSQEARAVAAALLHHASENEAGR